MRLAPAMLLFAGVGLAPLTLGVSSGTANTGDTITLTPGGGLAPYTMSMSSAPAMGYIKDSTHYVAGLLSATDVVQVTDALGHTATANVVVTGVSPDANFRSDLGVTLVSGVVSVWADQSGNGKTLSQATGASRPSFTASDAAYNNRAVLGGAGSQWLQSAFFAVTVQPFTFVVVGQYAADGNVYLAGSGADIVYSSGANAIMNGGLTVNSGKSPATPRAMLARFNGASSKIGMSDWVSGGVTGDAGALTMFSLNLFSQISGGFAATAAKCGEYMWFRRALSGADETKIANYLGPYWGLTIT